MMIYGRNSENLIAAAAAGVSSSQHFDPAAFTALKGSGLCEAVLKAAAQAIIAVDEAGRVVLANPMFETMFGHTGSEILGRPLETLIPKRNRKDHIAHEKSRAKHIHGSAGVLQLNPGTKHQQHGARPTGSDYNPLTNVTCVRYQYTISARRVLLRRIPANARKQASLF
jgi:PAS domain-containing protein